MIQSCIREKCKQSVRTPCRMRSLTSYWRRRLQIIRIARLAKILIWVIRWIQRQWIKQLIIITIMWRTRTKIRMVSKRRKLPDRILIKLNWAINLLVNSRRRRKPSRSKMIMRMVIAVIEEAQPWQISWTCSIKKRRPLTSMPIIRTLIHLMMAQIAKNYYVLQRKVAKFYRVKALIKKVFKSKMHPRHPKIIKIQNNFKMIMLFVRGM